MTATVILQQIQARQSSPKLEDLFTGMQMPERVTEFKEDPLILSCTVKRLGEEGQGYRSMDDSTVIELITDQDRVLAKNIKEYYTKKFFWRALSDNRSLSDFRLRLINLLENTITKCKDRDCGLYYKLPYFYQEDLVYEQFKKTYKTTNLKLDVRIKTKEILELKFLEKTLTSQQKRKTENFWFTDGEVLFCIPVEQNNPLLEIFTSLIDIKDKVKFHSYKTICRVDQMQFYKLYQFNFIK